jgi:hypothetical protein
MGVIKELISAFATYGDVIDYFVDFFLDLL